MSKILKKRDHIKNTQNSASVLVGVLKSKKDLHIVLNKKWYRIPYFYLPKRKFQYVAFYQPAVFGNRGKRIEYYARARGEKILKRIDLLPEENDHPWAHEDYVKISLGAIQKLPKPIKNVIPRRVVFGFTSLEALLSSKDMLELYGIPKIEKIVETQLKRSGIKTVREYTVSRGGTRCRIDIAIFCKNGKIAVECDNIKSHSSKNQIMKDMKKDAFLRHLGWRVMRLKEKDIIERLNWCVFRIKKAKDFLDA